MRNGEGVIDAMAEAILHVDLSRSEDAAMTLFMKGYRGSDIGDDLPRIIALARLKRAALDRNQPVNVALIAAQF
jgi:hypothetical protein